MSTRSALLLALALCSCHRTTTAVSTEHTASSTTTETHTSESGAQTTTTTTTEAAGKTTTVTEEYAPPSLPLLPEKEEAPREATAPQENATAGTGPRIPKLSRHGPLVKRTVTIIEPSTRTTEMHEQATTQAQGTTDTKTQATDEKKAETRTDVRPAVSCAFAGWMWGVLVIGGILGIVVLALRRRGIV